jgi:hypothetical protein
MKASKLLIRALLITIMMSTLFGYAHSQGTLQSLEDAIETNTAEVFLPSSTGGSITRRDCGQACAFSTLQLTDESTFFVGGSKVTLAEFKSFIAKTGPQFLMIFHKPGQPVVTRLIVFGRLPTNG